MSLNSVHALIVDDEEELLQVLEKIVGPLFTSCQTASLPTRAIEICRSTCLDIVILDVRMPEMDGLELLGKLREIRPELCAVFLTGHGEKETIKKAIRLKVFEFLEKPIEISLLRDVLARAIEQVRRDRVNSASLSVAKMVLSRDSGRK
jgi:DNA-binding NtrC family response regulator